MVTAEGSWLLFLHQIPPKPVYFRAKVLRRLNQLGALGVKRSAYLLPANDDTLEDLQWLLREIRSEGGEGWIFRCEAVAGYTDDGLRAAFRALRSPDWTELSEAARRLLDNLRAAHRQPEDAVEGGAEWERLQQRRAELQRIDFFGAQERVETEALMAEIEREVAAHARNATGKEPRGGPLGSLRGRTWVTRAGVRIDRIASAWLIRRFIDPAARFEFVDPASWTPGPNDLRFDMFEGEFTHEGDRCTFEVLVERSALRDRALAELAEIVHDVDFKDAKFGRPEAAGVASLVDGMALHIADDAGRIEEGARVFDALYARLRSSPSG